MPQWAGKWKGGRYYLDTQGRKVFFIERRKRSVRLQVHDDDLALGELTNFLKDPDAYCRAPEPRPDTNPVYITQERVDLYLESIHSASQDHKKARISQLHGWASYRDSKGRALDLRTVDKTTLRIALGSFTGGHRGRVEALNTFANFLVQEGDQGLSKWHPFSNTRPSDPEAARAERVAYSVEQVEQAYRQLVEDAIKAKGNPRVNGGHGSPVRDAFMLRAATGMHHTEIQQLEGAKVYKGPLPDRGAGIRILEEGHEIAGVIQIRQKTKPRHRYSVTAEVLAAALRLTEGVPSRITMYYALTPLGIVPSNLRHTWITQAGENATLITYKSKGVSLDVIQQTGGHRVGSKVTLSNYDKTQIPPLVLLSYRWTSLEGNVGDVPDGRGQDTLSPSLGTVVDGE